MHQAGSGSKDRTVYLAGRFSRRAEILGYVPIFERAGFEVTSRWLTTPQHLHVAGISAEEYAADPHADRINDLAQDHQCEIAKMDLEDVARASAFVIFTHDPGDTGSRGGRLIEYGYALGLQKEIIICGPRESFFFMLDWPNITQAHTPEWAAGLLRARAELGRYGPPRVGPLTEAAASAAR